MTRLHTTTKFAAGLVLACLTTCTLAQPRILQEGRDYARIEPPLVTETEADRIEMLDVFWYGCPQCAEFEPMATYWGGEIRGDLIMRRMPAVWNDVMRLHAQLYFTAKALGVEQRAHSAAFSMIHEQHEALNDVASIRRLFATLGIEADTFDAAWSSKEVKAEVQRAEQETRAAGIDQLPAMLVNGRYRVARNASVRELPDIFITVNELIKGQRNLRRP